MVYEVLNDFAADQPFCVIVKHQNPCGAALAETQAQAFARALAGDSKSAFGGIVGLNGAVGEDTARALAEIFLEVIVAPDFTPAALAVLKKRKNLRLLRLPLGYRNKWDFRPVSGGFVMQTRDALAESAANFVAKTSHPISDQERQDAEFAWRLVKYVRSNGILLARQGMVVGVGAGQMSRIDSVALAVSKAQPAVAGSVLASDAYFPFPDSVEIAARNGIRVLVEPGGSVKDGEVIAAAEKLGVALLFTGVRHFRH
jgi:phosphoribosylaminoimidazolecarboxamide formyltransferase/IMP cyclohydrolase